TLFHTYASPTVGRLRLELGLLDVANNLIFDGLGADPALEDTVRSYGRKPYLLAASWESPVYHGFRAEMIAGLQTRTLARVRSQSLSALAFRWRENARYAGLQLEYGGPWTTVGAQLRV